MPCSDLHDVQPKRSLIQRKDAPLSAAYEKQMKRARCLSRLQLCLTVLSVLMVLAGPWAQGFAMAAEAATIVICSDGTMKTVTVDPQGKSGHPAQDCRDCPACILPLPANLAQAADVTRPTAWRPAVHPQALTAVVLSRRAPGPLSRGPPIQHLWFRA